MTKLRLLIPVAVLAVAACGGSDDDSASDTTTEPSTASTAPAEPTEVVETTDAPATTRAPTTTRATTTTVRTTTTTTPADPLEAAFAAAGLAAPTDDVRDAIQTLCDGFTNKDAEAINLGAKEIAEQSTGATVIQAGFGALCPENAALLGTFVMPSGDPVFPGYPLIVDVGTIDSRVANSFEGSLVNGQVVALAPGRLHVVQPERSGPHRIPASVEQRGLRHAGSVLPRNGRLVLGRCPGGKRRTSAMSPREPTRSG